MDQHGNNDTDLTTDRLAEIRDTLSRRPGPPAIGEPALVTAREAARLYGVSAATWHRMVAAGRVPAPVRTSPGCVRWRLEELRAHIAGGCQDRRTWEALRAAQRNGRPR
jgi:predicted DNA-binding transcriptional regulator AlpA